MYEAVIFDMDGVLVNSEFAHARAWQEVLAASGCGLDVEYLLMRGAGVADEDFVLRMRGEYNVSTPAVDLLAQKRERYLQLAQTEVELFPGALPLLESLSWRCKLGLATSSPWEQADLFLERFNFRHYFQAIGAREDVARLKPFPDIYLYVMRQLDVSPSRGVAVEDSPTGVTAACAAGLPVVAVATTHSRHSLAHASIVLSSLEPTQRILDAIGTVCCHAVP